jgi:hypothetical protein
VSPKYYLGNQIKKNAMGGACCRYWGEERSMHDFDGKRDNLEDICVDGSIILKWALKKWGGTSWTELIWLRIGTVSGRLCMR